MKNTICRFDKKNKFMSVFNLDSGFYMRTGILDENGSDTEEDPFQASFPELLDIGVMGKCTSYKECAESGIQCYQQASKFKDRPNMSLENFKKIIDEISGKTFQVAVGGSGNPDDYEHFEEMVRYAREHKVVPNYTTSGINMTLERAKITKDWCGAVAVSAHWKPYTYKAIELFLEAGCKTNIHYVLGSNSIDEAIRRLKENDWPTGINAIIFLLEKLSTNVLQPNDPRIAEFFNIIDNNKFDFKVGFDSCTVCSIINYTENINMDSCDTCEGARFSAYVTPDMFMLPCSFDTEKRTLAVDLKTHSVQEAWDSEQFEIFRNSLKKSCPECPDRKQCMGSCPLIESPSNLCGRECKELYRKN